MTTLALLGSGPPRAAGEPLPVAGAAPRAVETVAAGARHTCALTDAGRVWCWGANDRGQLGRDDVGSSAAPVLVEGVSGVTDLTAGGAHTCARAPGATWCWGANGSGQLGDGTTADRFWPVRSLAAGVTQLSAGRAHTCAVAANGSHEVQRLDIAASAGGYRLSFGASRTTELDWDAGPATVQSALNGLSANWDVGVRPGRGAGVCWSSSREGRSRTATSTCSAWTAPACVDRCAARRSPSSPTAVAACSAGAPTTPASSAVA
ncbi:RCC1 domain-containing protein [Nocardioides sambongensis]|uniref:RCC1 domain-containing protein n=1 Tax=Nocardioides sambongensis TaxID=2589074 RepID=UPI0015E82BD6|nr:hypothetical protein [Nocardioides sambongensis]